MRRGLLLLVILAALLPACGSEMASNVDVVEDNAPIGPEITRLAFRDRVLVVHTGERFSLLDDAGNVLAAHVTREELAVVAPREAALYQEMATASAIDASVDPELLESGEPFEP